MRSRIFVLPLLVLGLLAGSVQLSPPSAQAASLDVVVVGGTPAGVAAAIAAAEHGASVTLVAEGRTVGGMMSNGISASDIGVDQVVQGISRNFFYRIRKHYGDWDTWRFEPKVAESTLKRMLSEAGVRVVLFSPLERVEMSGSKVSCATFRNLGRLCAPSFIDASYTGELIRLAQVPNNLGPADMLAYGETMAERRTWGSLVTVPDAERSSAEAAFAAHPYVEVDNAWRPSKDFSDGSTSFAYRLCVTNRVSNRVPFARPASYYSLVPAFRQMMRSVDDTVEKKSNGTLMSDVFHLAVLPNGKYDLNSGLLSYTNMPTPDGYFTSSYDVRMQHNRNLKAYVQSFFYFVQNDPSVPAKVKSTFRTFGLCKDEFVRTGNWPQEPYVREARRIEGRDMVTVHDIYLSRTKSDAVALGAYNIDTKLSRLVFSQGTLYRDYGVHAKAPVFEIPFGSMVPSSGVTNVLAPIGVDSSPTAYGTIRMEPQYMALGEAAGVAAAVAKKERKQVSQVSASRVQDFLRYRNVEYKAVEVCKDMSSSHRKRFGFSSSCQVLKVDWTKK